MNIKRIGLIGGSGVNGGNSSIKIVNDLTTGGADKALSAEQGKILNSTKQNTLNGTEFKTVNGSSIWGSGNIVITGEGSSVEIVNDLITGGADKALSAEMGKMLEGRTIIISKNLFDRSRVVPGFVDTATGNIMTNVVSFPNAIASPIIDVEPNTYYSISGRTDTKGMVGYDSEDNKVQIIEGSWGLPDYNGTFLTPSNVVKIQFSCVLNHKFSEIDLIQLEKGERITSYSEYYVQLVKEVAANLKSEQTGVIAKLNDTSTRATAVYDFVKKYHGNPEIMFPDYRGATQIVSGPFNAWQGFSTVSDLSSDSVLTGITFSGSLDNDYIFRARISKKIRDEEGIITGLQTVSDIFELTLKAGESQVDIPLLPFSADNVLEIEYTTVRNGLIKYAPNAADGVTWIKFKDQAVMPGSMWDVNVNLIPIRSSEQHSTKALKVLAIGNSFSEDSFAYVPFILRNSCPDINLTFGILYYGGCSLEQHYNHFVNSANAYAYRKITPQDNKWLTPSSSTSIQQALADDDWDIIVFQQNGSNAGNYETFQPYLNNLMKSIQSLAKKPVRFGWHIVEAYDSELEASVSRFNTYCEAAKKVVSDTLVDIVFPSATGLQNARTTSLQTLGDAGNLMHSSSHAQEGIPCYCLALPNVLVIADLCGYGYKGICGDSNIPTQSWITEKNIPNPNGSSVGATDENCKLAQLAGIFAHKKPYDITDLKTLGYE